MPPRKKTSSKGDSSKQKTSEAMDSCEVGKMDLLCSSIAESLSSQERVAESVCEDLVFLTVAARMYQHITGKVVNDSADRFILDTSKKPSFVSRVAVDESISLHDINAAIKESGDGNKRKRSDEETSKKSTKTKKTKATDVTPVTCKMYAACISSDFCKAHNMVTVYDHPYYEWLDDISSKIESVRGAISK